MLWMDPSDIESTIISRIFNIHISSSRMPESAIWIPSTQRLGFYIIISFYELLWNSLFNRITIKKFITIFHHVLMKCETDGFWKKIHTTWNWNDGIEEIVYYRRNTPKCRSQNILMNQWTTKPNMASSVSSAQYF